MSFELRIFFTGLCTFAPEAGGQVWRALLVDAREPARIPGRDDIRPHDAVIQFRSRNKKSESITGRPFQPFPDSQTDVKELWLLEHEMVEIETGGAGTPDSLDIKTCAGTNLGEVPATANDVECFEWVTPIVDTDGGLGRLKQGLMTNPLPSGPNADLIMGAVRLDKGRLRPASFSAFDGQFVVWEFPDDNSRRTAAVSVVELTLTINAPSVTLTGTRFNGHPGHSVELQPDPAEGPFVEVWVMNREPELIRAQSIQVPRLGGTKPHDREYELLYDLIENRPPVGNHQPPTAVAFRTSPAFAAFNPPRCQDFAMSNAYFARTSTGENGHSAPCAPAQAGGD